MNMASCRSKRERKVINNYKTLNSKGFDSCSSQEEVTYESDHFELEADPEGEWELCGHSDVKTLDSEDLDMEEGKVNSSDEDEDEDDEVKKYMEAGDINQLKKILKKQEDENLRLQ